MNETLCELCKGSGLNLQSHHVFPTRVLTYQSTYRGTPQIYDLLVNFTISLCHKCHGIVQIITNNFPELYDKELEKIEIKYEIAQKDEIRKLFLEHLKQKTGIDLMERIKCGEVKM